MCLLLFYWICKLILQSDCEVEIFLADLQACGDEPTVQNVIQPFSVTDSIIDSPLVSHKLFQWLITCTVTEIVL